MTPLIAFCGLDCARCDARTATIHDDDALRQQVARQWSEWNQVDIPATSINCLGCRTEGVKCPYCDSMCPIRQCALQKGVSHCGECPESPDCSLLQQVHRNAPEAQANPKTPTSPFAESPKISDFRGALKGEPERVFPSLISGHFIDNPASGKVMEKCGFVPTGDICYDPTLHSGTARPIRVLRLLLY